MEAITRLITFVSDNWAAIVALLVAAFGLYKKFEKTIKDWKAKSDAEKQAEIDKQIEVAKKMLSEAILNMVSNAEVEWVEHGLGEIKRSQVLDQIYTNYPILAQVVNQDELVAYIDTLINEALKIVREKIRIEE